MGALGRRPTSQEQEKGLLISASPSPMAVSLTDSARADSADSSVHRSALAPPRPEPSSDALIERSSSGDGASVLLGSISAVQNLVSPWEKLHFESSQNMGVVMSEHLELASVLDARRAIKRMLQGRYHHILPAKLDVEQLMTLKVQSVEAVESLRFVARLFPVVRFSGNACAQSLCTRYPN